MVYQGKQLDPSLTSERFEPSHWAIINIVGSLDLENRERENTIIQDLDTKKNSFNSLSISRKIYGEPDFAPPHRLDSCISSR